MDNNAQDTFEANVDKRLQALKACQESLSLFSCSSCDKMFECEIRKSYVDSVYTSMSKGEDGSFDFDV